MQIKNTTTRYGMVAILFHWIMVVLLIGLIGVGLYMEDLPVSFEKLKLYGWHKQVGLLALFLIILRLLWRLKNITPELTLPVFERIAARTVHWLFYILIVALPVTGWIMSSAAGLSVSFFGLFVMPNLVPANKSTMELFLIIHHWLAYGLITLIVLHSLAALKHHFIDKDDILRRMV